VTDIVPIQPEKKLLKMMQGKYPGFHPAMILADLANDEDGDVSIRLNAAKSLLPYIEPQLKSLEVYGNVKHDHGQLKVSIKPHTDHTPLPTAQPPAASPKIDVISSSQKDDIIDAEIDDVINDAFGTE
jgi:hypothetical protein